MKVVIVGNNVAGITTAKTIRDLRSDVDIAVFAKERYHYYPRPMLIEYIAGNVPEKDLFFYGDDWYSKNRIRVHLSTPVERIDPRAKKVLAGGQWVSYEALVLATGADAFVPPIKGLPRSKVFTLRTLDDAKAIKDAMTGAQAAVVIGGGLLGLESARALAEAKPGMSITVLERGDHLLQRQLDVDGGAILRALIEEMGIDVLTGVEVSEISGPEDGMVVMLADGRELRADMTIISAGARANTRLAEEAGLSIGRGIIVDSSLCCDADARVFAVGDVIEHEGRWYGIIPAALEQAKLAAKKILGQEAPDYSGTIPSNTLKVAGVDLSSIGLVSPPAEDGSYEEIRAKSDDGRVYKKFVLKDGKLVGAILLGSRKEVSRVTKLIREGSSVVGLKGKMKQVEFDFSGL